MISGARYVHTNLIAHDWRRLAKFYQDILGCVPVPPERDFRNESLNRLANLKNAHLTGMHSRLPGYGDIGPTLEIFQYEPELDKPATAINRQGFGHIAFSVEDVQAARKEVLAAGGSALGEIVTLQTVTGAEVTCCYVADPEGNGIELQSWS